MIRRGFLLLLLLWPAVGTAAADERILAYDVDVRIAADGALTVTETIRVRAEGREIRRGIYRDFPTLYRDRYGNRVRVPFEVVAVRRDGSPEPWHGESIAGGKSAASSPCSARRCRRCSPCPSSSPGWP